MKYREAIKGRYLYFVYILLNAVASFIHLRENIVLFIKVLRILFVSAIIIEVICK